MGNWEEKQHFSLTHHITLPVRRNGSAVQVLLGSHDTNEQEILGPGAWFFGRRWTVILRWPLYSAVFRSQPSVQATTGRVRFSFLTGFLQLGRLG